MRSSTLILLTLVATTPGCATLSGSRTSAAATLECESGLHCLPDQGSASTRPSAHMQRGRTLAALALAMPPPPSPSEPEAGGLGHFWQALDGWIERRTDAVEGARRELDEAAEEEHRQRIVGGAIVGMMYEEMARELSEIPAPRELDDEPEIRDVYRSALEGRARPFVRHARRAYSACAQNAVSPRDMHDWSRFCAAREDGLPERDFLGAGLRSGETVVEVIAAR